MELFLAMVSYAVVLLGSIKVLHYVSTGWLRVVIAVLPVIPVAFVLMAVIRLYSRIDEMQRRIHLEAAALAAAITALLAILWGFLEGVGCPKLSGFWTFAMIDALWGVFVLILRHRYQ